ncbi:hypothetical protein V1502_02225 [Bacillus sp. SCS-153A]|uniref:hypothetical protein n=1 Tax=Rossellomorea sedimentorum TaxID=3115294 RepID=UPI003906BF5A
MRVFFYPTFIPPYIPPPVYKYYFLQKFQDIEELKQKQFFPGIPMGSFVFGEYLPSGYITPTSPTSPANVRLIN